MGKHTTDSILDTLVGLAVAVGTLALMIGLVVVLYIWMGYVTTLAFAWYLVPLFGVPQITIPTGIALAFIGSWFSGNAFTFYADKDRTTKEIFYSTLRWAVLYPVVLYTMHTFWPVVL